MRNLRFFDVVVRVHPPFETGRCHPSWAQEISLVFTNEGSAKLKDQQPCSNSDGVYLLEGATSKEAFVLQDDIGFDVVFRVDDVDFADAEVSDLCDLLRKHRLTSTVVHSYLPPRYRSAA